MPDLARDGFVVFDHDPRVAKWAAQAHSEGCAVTRDPDQRAKWLRHGETWFVGVDALPNAPDGSIGAVPLAGAWVREGAECSRWHRAQLSVVFPGYPIRDPQESEAAHRFRIKRCGAHVDGLHLEDGRRMVREPHAFILGIPLNASTACPLVVWQGSHNIMRAALRHVIGPRDPIGTDVTEVYKATRAQVFETCKRIDVQMGVGQAVLLDSLAVHGVAPWGDGMEAPSEGRMVAYFRPALEDAKDWLV